MVKQNGIVAKQAAELEQKKKPQTLADYVNRMLPQIARALPATITPERFTRITLTALSSNKDLAKCSQDSFLGAMMQAAQLGLEPNTPTGQAYLIPYAGKCQFQLGYRGLLELVHRSGEISTIGAYVVHAGDTFEFELGLEPRLVHKPTLTNRGDAIAYYAYYKTRDGGCGFEVMSREDVESHAKRFSKAYNSGPWKDNFDEMAKKTVLKKVLKYAPMKIEFVQAVQSDEQSPRAVQDVDGGFDVVCEYDADTVEAVEAPEQEAEHVSVE